MADELVDIFDGDGKPTGVTKLKSEAHRDGLWHRAVHVWLYNSRGEILLQLRAKGKQLYPGVWDLSAAGHVAAGEDPVAAAARELEEELGLRVAQADLEFFKSVKNSPPYPGFSNNEFYFVYFCKFNGRADELKLQGDEVEAARLFSIDQVEADLSLDRTKFVPHGEYWQDALSGLKRVIKDELN